MYRRRPDEGEQILLQAKLVWRAIKLNIALFRWERCATSIYVFGDLLFVVWLSLLLCRGSQLLSVAC